MLSVLEMLVGIGAAVKPGLVQKFPPRVASARPAPLTVYVFSRGTCIS